jgi:hypothetical protein
MALFQKRPTKFPATAPNPDTLPTPDPQVMNNKSLFQDMQLALSDAVNLATDPHPVLKEATLGLSLRLAARLWGEGLDSRSDDGLKVIETGIGVGIACGEVEARRGWRDEGSEDARIHNALILAWSSTKAVPEHLSPLYWFSLQLGYWYTHQEPSAVEAFIAQQDVARLLPP